MALTAAAAAVAAVHSIDDEIEGTGTILRVALDGTVGISAVVQKGRGQQQHCGDNDNMVLPGDGRTGDGPAVCKAQGLVMVTACDWDPAE